MFATLVYGNVGTTIPSLEPMNFGDTEFWRHRNIGDTECFDICTTIPDLGTNHPLPWVGCVTFCYLNLYTTIIRVPKVYTSLLINTSALIYDKRS